MARLGLMTKQDNLQEIDLQENGERVKRLYSRLREHRYDLVSVPSLIRQIVQNNRWQKFTVEKTGQVVEHESFLDFVTQQPPEGLGATYKNIWILCQDDLEVQEMLSSLVPNESVQLLIEKVNDVKPSLDKFSKNQDFLRLKREAEKKGNQKAAVFLKQIQEGIKDEKGKPITPYRALIELGIRKRPVSIPKSVSGTAAKLQMMFNQKQITELVSILSKSH